MLTNQYSTEAVDVRRLLRTTPTALDRALSTFLNRAQIHIEGLSLDHEESEELAEAITQQFEELYEEETGEVPTYEEDGALIIPQGFSLVETRMILAYAISNVLKWDIQDVETHYLQKFGTLPLFDM